MVRTGQEALRFLRIEAVQSKNLVRKYPTIGFTCGHEEHGLGTEDARKLDHGALGEPVAMR